MSLEDIFRTEKWQLPEDAANAAWREDKGANFGPKSDKSKRAACSGSATPIKQWEAEIPFSSHSGGQNLYCLLVFGHI